MQKSMQEQKGLVNDTSKAMLVVRLVAIFWLIAKLIGWKLWISDRTFPLIPVFDFINWPSAVHYSLFVLSLGIICFLIFKPINKLLLIVLLCVELLSCAADQTRWQPWEYQYIFTIAICIINFNDHKKIVGCIAFTIASTYLYSGIGKLNEGYLSQVWENIFLKRIFNLSAVTIEKKIIHYIGYCTAIFEILFSIGLLFYKTRRISAYGMMAMHLFILYSFGPWGINYNTIIWPWNILMIALLYIIFIKDKAVQFNKQTLWQGWNKMVVLCWGILPALNYVGLWDSYLSSRLYSGELPHMVICLKDEAEIEEMQPYLSRTDVHNLCTGQKMVTLQTWAMKEMNVPPYPEMRVYKKAENKWRSNHTGTTAIFIYYSVTGTKKIKRIDNK